MLTKTLNCKPKHAFLTSFEREIHSECGNELRSTITSHIPSFYNTRTKPRMPLDNPNCKPKHAILTSFERGKHSKCGKEWRSTITSHIPRFHNTRTQNREFAHKTPNHANPNPKSQSNWALKNQQMRKESQINDHVPNPTLRQHHNENRDCPPKTLATQI